MAARFAVKSIDHVVLTCRKVPATVDFYTTKLGMKHEVFTSGGVERFVRFPGVPQRRCECISPSTDGIFFPPRHALRFGNQKLNLHQSGKEFEPKAGTVQPGSEDLCFITDYPVDEVLKAWTSAGIDVSCRGGNWGSSCSEHSQVLEGSKVVDRTGAVGKLRSVYCRDPDGNLVE